ncbi:plastocyanin/azurin family copper-binding protein [Pedobacter africanus]|uniref:Copper binding protein, plastocyanin/azurin family n=1 Tax=Pedobacter africanus TaxID=151894 RepID=A0A1W2AYT0_9SPHI|nr:plastocyanin/azurin family copper-binding protein [Pedobacter africanus]SMC65690.1 Copper binding protein, plastocyanin/azurin family [Pedobacter africanus]
MCLAKRMIMLLLFVLQVKYGMGQPAAAAPTVIELKVLPGLQYDVVRFTVKPGAAVKLNFTNTDDMSHNLLITKPGARVNVVNAALQLEEKGPAMNYVPKSADVLWSIPVVSPDQTRSLTFKAPAKAGAYPYVCTFPGHGFVMYGVMYVNAGGEMPDIKTDPNIPPSRQEEQVAAAASQDMHNQHDMHKMAEPKKVQANHPYTPVAPYLYRIFMEDAGPAAIAVSLPQELSYCWDAGLCRLRYAWKGGFVDNTGIWKGHADAVAKIVGTIFYREIMSSPLRIGKADEIPVAAYKGYRLVNKYPEFHYTLNGTDVYELILPKEDGKGLIRKFRIPDAGKTVWLACGISNESETYEASSGVWEKDKLKLSPQQARDFSVTITSYPLVYNKKRR